MDGINHKVYAVKDELTGKFLQPVYHENNETATRWFKYVLNHTEMWKYNAAMYSLYYLADFNDKTGFYGECFTPSMVCGGVSVLDKE